MTMEYVRHTAVYRHPSGRTERAVLRIRADIADKRADALRQLIGNHMSVVEVINVVEGIHDPRVDVVDGRSYPYRPACSCGWESTTHSNRNVAQRVADAHAAGRL